MRILITFVGFFAAAANSNIVDIDDRVAVESGDERFAPTGRATVGSARYGTAFLIGECIAATARHLSIGGLRTGQRVKLSFPAAKKRVRTKGTVVLVPSLKEGYNADWAFVLLDHCLGRTIGYYRLEPTLPSPGLRLASLGFPADRRGKLVMDPECRIRGGTPWGIGHDCAALPGNSGGPVFMHEKHGLPVVVGMIVAGYHQKTPVPYTEHQPNLVLPASVLAQALSDFRNTHQMP